MIDKLFTYDEMDQVDAYLFHYENCKLTRDIGIFPINSEIDCISIDYDTGEMIFYSLNPNNTNEDSKLACFELELTVKS